MAVKSPPVPQTEPGKPHPSVAVLSCEVIQQDVLRICAYDHLAGRALRGVLRRQPDASWFVDGRIRLVGGGAPFDRAELEARAEAALTAFASDRDDEVAGILRGAEAEAPPRIDEAAVRRAARSRRLGEKEARAALSLAASLRERVGRTLAGFPYAFEMQHRGTRLDVVVSSGEPMLRIVGKGVSVSILWDGGASGQPQGSLPPQSARSLALQAARRRAEPLQPMALLLKARWAAIAHEAEAVRLESPPPRATGGERAVALPVPPPDRDGWRAVDVLPDRTLQVRIHDLPNLRQIDALARVSDGRWEAHGEMVALSFRTGRREGVSEPELDAWVARVAETTADQARAAPPPALAPAPPPLVPDLAWPTGPEEPEPVPIPADSFDATGIGTGHAGDPAHPPYPYDVADAPPDDPVPAAPRDVEGGLATHHPSPDARPAERKPDVPERNPAPPAVDPSPAPDVGKPLPPMVFAEAIPPEGEAEGDEVEWDWDHTSDPPPGWDGADWALDAEDGGGDELTEEDLAALERLPPPRRTQAPAAPAVPDDQTRKLLVYLRRGERLRAEGRLVEAFPHTVTVAGNTGGDFTIRVDLAMSGNRITITSSKPMKMKEGEGDAERIRIANVELTYSTSGKRMGESEDTTHFRLRGGYSWDRWIQTVISEADAIAVETLREGVLGDSIRAELARRILEVRDSAA